MKTRLAEVLAMMMIGDGLAGALQPTKHIERWRYGPQPWQRRMSTFADRPNLTRALSLAELAAGVAMIFRLPARAK